MLKADINRIAQRKAREQARRAKEKGRAGK
jgi:hypothetical protein